MKTSEQHGCSGTKLFYIWCAMKSRCCRPKDKSYEWYGARGITVCPEWRESFLAFKAWAESAGYEEGLSIERRDVNGDYEPGNCHWIPKADQPKNTRKQRFLTAFGETKRIRDWLNDDRCVVGKSTLIRRLDRSEWTDEEAISTPARDKSDLVKAGRKIISEIESTPVPTDENERWAEIPGWTAYQASTLGRIRSRWKMVGRTGEGRGVKRAMGDEWRLLTPRGRSNKHAFLTLIGVDGSKRDFPQSHLILFAFVGPRPDGMEACHFPDPNPLNCRLSNLRWDTHGENMRDRHRVDMRARQIVAGD